MINIVDVDIVLPTRNRPGYLKEALESIFEQSYKHWKLIIVDGSDSPIENKKILSRFSQNKIKYIYSVKSNKLKYEQSIANARNIGMRCGKAKYIAHIDDDNIFLPDHIEILVSALEGEVNSEFAYANSLRINMNCKPAAFQAGGAFSLKKLKEFNFIASDDVMHSRKIFKKVGPIREDLEFYADWEYWTRMAIETKVVYIPDILTVYREHKGQASNQLSKVKHQKAYEKVKKIIKEEVSKYLQKSNSITKKGDRK